MGLKMKFRAAVLIVVLLLLPGVSHSLTYDQKALRGLKGVHVGVEYIDPEVGRLGLTADQIKTDVELRLRKAGIRVLTLEELVETPGSPTLIVTVNTIIRQGSPFVAYSISVALHEWVTIERGFKTPGTIWHKGGIGTVGMAKVREIRLVGDYVDKFINDYLAANPRK